MLAHPILCPFWGFRRLGALSGRVVVERLCPRAARRFHCQVYSSRLCDGASARLHRAPGAHRDHRRLPQGAFGTYLGRLVRRRFAVGMVVGLAVVFAIGFAVGGGIFLFPLCWSASPSFFGGGGGVDFAALTSTRPRHLASGACLCSVAVRCHAQRTKSHHCMDQNGVPDLPPARLPAPSVGLGDEFNRSA